MGYMIEDRSRICLHMPLAREKGFVARSVHELRPHALITDLLLKLRLKISGPQNKAAGIDHCATGHAYGTMPTAHIISLRESSPLIG